ncbi:HCP-like protein [Cristinia sonorae]|uniref:HCP-like protein n=1 Tax=Cristinia sonorae TaxID=1940300 RepID=A0A8K0XQL5_9AGAR|nr:HCP-like protein [Cristinia sonorae]
MPNPPRQAPPNQPVFRGEVQPQASGLPRPASSNSVYSSYSYYPYEGNISTPPTPGTPQFALQPSTSQASLNSRGALSPSPTPAHPRDPDSYELSSPDALTNPRTPQDYLQLGIAHHIANRLEDSAKCFEKSATLDQGCGVGMLMWGLALRHGWGVPQNEARGFKWLRKAAEGAVSDLESAKAGMVDTSAIKSELVIAIYEVGQSFFRGWGVEKDKKMGVNYFRVAARLGDPDAQQNLAFALEHGKGCKKDRKEAALWYRAAVKQGVSDIGLAWIYKEKFQ